MEARAPLPYLQALRDGLLLYRGNRWAEAIEAFDRAHDAAPSEMKPGYYRAKALIKLQLAEAKKNAKKNDEEMKMAVTRTSAGLQDKEPGYPEYLRGMAAYLEGKIPQAKEEFMKAEGAGCQRADLFLSMGMIEMNQGNESLALDYFHKASLSNDLDTKSGACLWLGVIAMENLKYTNYSVPQAYFETVLKNFHKNNLLAWVYQGKLNRLQGEMASEDKDQYFARAADCYKRFLSQDCFEVPLYVRLLWLIEVRRLPLQYKKAEIDRSSIQPDQLIAQLIAQLKSKECKSIEEMCVLFVGQVSTSKWEQAWQTLFQLLNMPLGEKECLYDNIPYYLKHDFFTAMIVWPVNKLQPLQYTDKTEQLKKRVVVDLLKVRDTENYDIRLVQINAGLLALTQQSLLGSILYIKQGLITSPNLYGGKLGELAVNLTGVLNRMGLNASAPFLLATSVKPVLQAHKELLEGYPVIYKAIDGKEPPVCQSWFGSLFGSATAAAAAAANTQPCQSSPLPQPDTFKQAP